MQITAQEIANILGGTVRGNTVLANGFGHKDKTAVHVSVMVGSEFPDGFWVNCFSDKDDPINIKNHILEKRGSKSPHKANGASQPRQRFSSDDIDKAVLAVAAAQAQQAPSPKNVIASYDYCDESGTLLYQVVRLEPKDFRHRRPDGIGGWIWRGSERRVPYRWADLLKHPDATVFVCEGERDADRIAGLDLCATTVASGEWTDDCVKALVGRDVIILEDNDATGRKKSHEAAVRLHPVAKSVRIRSFIDLPEGGDVSDWLDLHRVDTDDALISFCWDAPEWMPRESASAPPTEPDETSCPPPGLGEWDAGDDAATPPPRGWLLGVIFCRRFMSSLLADGGVGKTALRYAQLLSLATGRLLTGEHVFQRCRVLIVSLEDDCNELRRRIRAACLHHGIKPEELKGWLFLAAPGAGGGKLMTTDKNGRPVRGAMADNLEAVIAARAIDVVSLDPFVKAHSVEENNNSGIDDVVQVLTDLSAKYDIAVDAPHHTSKGPPDPGNANKGRGASSMKDAGRLVYTLTTMSPEEAKAFGIGEDQRRGYIRMDSAKVNITRHLGAAKWFRLVGVRLGNATEMYPNGDEVQTVEPWTPPETWADLNSDLLNKILTAIEEGLPDGNRYSAGPNVKDRAAWRVVTEHAPQKTEVQAREIIKTWVKNGVLEEDEYDNPATRKKVMGLKVIAAKRPS
jgi:hypothetical protein